MNVTPCKACSSPHLSKGAKSRPLPGCRPTPIALLQNSCPAFLFIPSICCPHIFPRDKHRLPPSLHSFFFFFSIEQKASVYLCGPLNISCPEHLNVRDGQLISTSPKSRQRHLLTYRLSTSVTAVFNYNSFVLTPAVVPPLPFLQIRHSLK